MKIFLLLFLLSLGLSAAAAPTPVTYKVWCTPHNSGEREYTVPGAITGSVDLPIEMPDHGQVVCHIQENEGSAKMDGQEALPANILVALTSLQQLQATNGYVPAGLLNATFPAAYGKRFVVLDTPAYTVSIELTKG